MTQKDLQHSIEPIVERLAMTFLRVSSFLLRPDLKGSIALTQLLIAETFGYLWSTREVLIQQSGSDHHATMAQIYPPGMQIGAGHNWHIRATAFQNALKRNH